MTATCATPAPGIRARYPLDALRAIAAIGVVAFHAYQNNRFAGTETYPWTGFPHELMLSSEALVDLFFVLSGFLLWLPVARAALEGRRQRPARVLLLRRVARLVPLYLIVVLIVWLVSNPDMSDAHWQDLILHLTFTQVYSDQYIFWTVGPAWTLAVEFHYYLLIALSIPLVSHISGRATSHRTRVASVLALPAVMTVGGLGYLTWAIYISPKAGDAWSVWFGPIAKAPVFAFGLLLAVLVAAGKKITERKHRLLLGGSAAFVVIGGTMIRSILPGQNSQWLNPLFGLAAAALIANIVMSDGSVMRWLNWKPLVRLGILSYSIYLLHEPVMRFVRFIGILPEPGSWWGIPVTFVVVLAVTVALSTITYPMIEQYGMKILDIIGPDGRARNYYHHVQLSRRPSIRIDWVPDGELVGNPSATRSASTQGRPPAGPQSPAATDSPGKIEATTRW